MQIEKNRTLVSPEAENSKMARDLIRFLQGMNSADIYQYMYAEDDSKGPASSGMKNWDNVVAGDNAYYVASNETALVAECANDLAKAVARRSTLIELGPGSANAVMQKSLPLVQALRPDSYICADWFLTSVSTAAELVQKAMPDTTVYGYETDFFDSSSPIYSHTGANVMILGSSICNSSSCDYMTALNETIDQLRKIRRLMDKGASLIVTHDTNQNEDSLMAAYCAKDVQFFCTSTLWRLSTSLPVQGFDLDAVQYEAVWQPNSHLLSIKYFSTKDQTVDVCGTQVFVPRGRRMTMANSYKYPLSTFLHLAKIAGFASLDVRLDKQNFMALHILTAV